MINRIDGFVEEKNGNKYLNIADTNRNSELLKKYYQVFNGIKYHIKKIDGRDGVYEKEYMKIKFLSDDDIPLTKVLNFLAITVIITCVFEKNVK